MLNAPTVPFNGGTIHWLDNCYLIPEALLEEATARAETGKSVTFTRVERGGHEEWAYFTTGDQIRPGVRESIQEMQRQGIEVWLCTGGPRGKAEWFAEEVGLNNPEAGKNIFYDMDTMPEAWEDIPPRERTYKSESDIRALREAGEIRNKVDVAQLARLDGKQVLVTGLMMPPCCWLSVVKSYRLRVAAS